MEDTVETKEEIKMEVDDPSPIPPEVEDLSKSKVCLIIFIANLHYNMALDNKEVLIYLDFSTVNKREKAVINLNIFLNINSLIQLS